MQAFVPQILFRISSKTADTEALQTFGSEMSLYYDAVTVLTGDALQGSLKSRVYSPNASLKAKPAHVYALISECAKYDSFLKEVIDNAGFLVHEPKVCSIVHMSKAPLTDRVVPVCLAYAFAMSAPCP